MAKSKCNVTYYTLSSQTNASRNDGGPEVSRKFNTELVDLQPSTPRAAAGTDRFLTFKMFNNRILYVNSFEIVQF